jgi:hypothetical protein
MDHSGGSVYVLPIHHLLKTRNVNRKSLRSTIDSNDFYAEFRSRLLAGAAIIDLAVIVLMVVIIAWLVAY